MIVPPLPPAFDDLSRRAAAFFREHTHPVTGLTKDRAVNKPGGDAYTVASCASVGFALVADAVSAERGWTPKADAKARTVRALRYLNDQYPHEKGWLFHFVDWETGKRMWNSEASSIDTVICLAGMRVARQYWKDREITGLVDRFGKRMDWEWMRTQGGTKPTEGLVSMGYIPEKGHIDGRWGDTYDECKMLYVLGYGLSEMPTHGWAKIKREPLTYAGIEFLTGGPLFLHQMSESFYDFRGKRDRLGYSYEVATRNAALAQQAYTAANPGKFKAYSADFFGLSACDGPDGYSAFGAPGWINDNGTITPTSAVATLNVTPDAALRFTEVMKRDHPKAFGHYGYPNGYNPTRDWIDPDVIGIDLGMMLCAIENRRDGFVWRLTNGDHAIKRGFARIGLRKASGPELRR